jgi:hypothetical protein
LIEMLAATAIFASALLILFQFASAGQSVARAQPDAADVRQRVRVAAGMIQRDLLMAGAGLVHGADAGPLVNYLPPVEPRRTGARRADPELSFFDDRISILYVEPGAAAAPLIGDMPSAGSGVPIDPFASGCPRSGVCGLGAGTRALIVDTSGAGLGYDVFTVLGATAGLEHGPPDPGLSRAYPATGTRVVPVRQRVYYFDTAGRRLMLYDGHLTDAVVAEHIVLLRFQYFVEPSPGGAPRPPDGASNCVYAAGSPPAPLLADLGGLLLRAAGALLLTDGPLCGVAPHRFDGDLLRIRRVRVTIRAQAADPALRGSGADFMTQGVSLGSASRVPDIEVTFDVTPRNLQPTK